MGIKLFEIKSKRFEWFTKWSSTPPYATVASCWHRNLDLDPTGNNTSSPNWTSGKIESQRFEVACGLVQARGLQYLWPDSCCTDMDMDFGGGARQPFDCLKEYYSHARWCLLFMPNSLYPQSGKQEDSNDEVSEWPQEFHNPNSLFGLVLASRLEFFGFPCCTEEDRPPPCLQRLVSGVKRMDATRILSCPWNDISMGATSVILTTSSRNSTQKRSSHPILTVFTCSASSFRVAEDSRVHQNQRGKDIDISKYPSPMRRGPPQILHEHHDAVPSLQKNGKPGMTQATHYNHTDLPRTGQVPTGAYSIMSGWAKKQLNDTSATARGSDTIQNQNLCSMADDQTPLACFPTQQTQTRPIEVLLLEEKAEATSFESRGGCIKPSLLTNNEISPRGENSRTAKDYTFGNIRSWLDSNRLDQVTRVEENVTWSFAPSDMKLLGDRHQMEDVNEAMSESSIISERQWRFFDEWADTTAVLEPDNPLFFARNKVIQAALTKYTYQRKNEKTRNLQTPLSPSSSRKKEIACPFYKKDPVKYSGCLKRSRLLSMTHVKEHLLQCHRIPFYCPVCKKDFPTAKRQHKHIVKRACTLRQGFPFEGISDDQVRLLSRRHRHLSLKQQWHKVCELLRLEFPGSASPYLIEAGIIGGEVIRFREFWNKNGQRCVAECLGDMDLSHWDLKNEERDLACLYAGALDGALDTLIQLTKSLGCKSKRPSQ
ncbi:hypothetical protein EsH8_VII_000988 [Colletotrichum jinshuiense]